MQGKLDQFERLQYEYDEIIAQLLNEAMQPNPSPEYVSKDEIRDWLKSLIDESDITEKVSE